MTEVTDIKDNSPNDDLVRDLELLLKQAKRGDIRSMFYVTGWADDDVSCAWALDDRTGRLKFQGGVTIAVADLTINALSSDSDSAFRSILERTDS